MKLFKTLTFFAPIILALLVTASGLSADTDTPASATFSASSECMACHNQLTSSNGEDISIGTAWRGAMMSNSVTDPYWQAGVRKEITDHPLAAAEIEDTCSTCHMPMARYLTHQRGKKEGVFINLHSGNIRKDSPEAILAGDGVSCTVCHQISPENLGKKESFGANFIVDAASSIGRKPIFGPFEIERGNVRIMNSATGFVPTKGKHLQSSEMCGSCHTLYTHALDKNGHPVAELPEQMPYQEWLHSAYGGTQSCQDCHMDQVEGPAAFSSVLGRAHEPMKRHNFTGSNFYVLSLLSQNAAAMGLLALTSELSRSAEASRTLLKAETAMLTVDQSGARREGDVLLIPVAVENLAGHKLPTAYPSRRVWIYLKVTDQNGTILFESGLLQPDGAITGNDNDKDARRFEPHYVEISNPDEVQIYEAIMATPDGEVTTGLLSAASYVKDNRVLPYGFDKATAIPDVAVHGGASDDVDFTEGRDQVIYRVPMKESTGALTVVAELWYQPIGYRWAENLARVNALEPRRFLAMHRKMKGTDTALRITSTKVILETAPMGATPAPAPDAPAAP